MSHISRYVIWVHRSPQSLFGGASNPVIRNGSLLFFNDEGRARVECDRLNAHSGNPHVHYTVQFVDEFYSSLGFQRWKIGALGPGFALVRTALVDTKRW